jgi:dynein heavy chain 1
VQNKEEKLISIIEDLTSKYNLKCSASFIEKCLQLNQILFLHHGVMLVGPTGSGKTAAWKILLEALAILSKGTENEMKSEVHVIDPKTISKEDLYGKLDPETSEWSDGVLTQLLRDEQKKPERETTVRHWIIFDGDVDPVWAENLNSVLDDNKILTLPSGERL